jgi:hypothetical protein
LFELQLCSCTCCCNMAATGAHLLLHAAACVHMHVVLGSKGMSVVFVGCNSVLHIHYLVSALLQSLRWHYRNLARAKLSGSLHYRPLLQHSQGTIGTKIVQYSAT